MMYLFTYVCAPLPCCMSWACVTEHTSFETLIDEIRSSAESFFDPPEASEEALTAEGVYPTQARGVFRSLKRARESGSWEDLLACIPIYNETFEVGNPTGWDSELKIIADDAELRDFLQGDMGLLH